MSVEVWDPNSELVCEALLGRILGSTDHVAADLPEFTKWIETGFVTYTGLSGTVDFDTTDQMPMFRVSCWATTTSPGSTKAAPWGKAFHLAQVIIAALVRPIDGSTFPTPKPNYRNHRVITAYPATDPTRVPGDPSGFARVDFDFVLDWAVVP